MQASVYYVQTELISVCSTWLCRKPGDHNGSVTFLFTQKVTTCHCQRTSSKTFTSGIGQASLPCSGNGGAVSLQGRAGLRRTEQFLGPQALCFGRMRSDGYRSLLDFRCGVEYAVWPGYEAHFPAAMSHGAANRPSTTPQPERHGSQGILTSIWFCRWPIHNPSTRTPWLTANSNFHLVLKPQLLHGASFLQVQTRWTLLGLAEASQISKICPHRLSTAVPSPERDWEASAQRTVYAPSVTEPKPSHLQPVKIPHGGGWVHTDWVQWRGWGSRQL